MMSPPLMSTAAFDNPNFACFFSLLRDKFRLSIDYKMSIEELEEVVAEWENLVGKAAAYRHHYTLFKKIVDYTVSLTSLTSY